MNDLLHMPKCAAYNITADIMEYCIPLATLSLFDRIT